ncbi:MAG: NAD(P)H-dependent oxidoreductase [Candidatus Omnitrophica bacterium]|nr:NAD(P)H-dependent oxidoreductase [Candidatus Omnitrophota bacterium]
MKKILIVYHSQSGNTARLARAVKQGAAACGAKIILKKASDAKLTDLLSADGYCFGTPDYFSYMAGALKDFFDRTCYPSEGKITGRPYICFVSHGGGGAASCSLRRMGKRFALKLINPPLLFEGAPRKADLKKACLLGEKLARRVLKAD